MGAWSDASLKRRVKNAALYEAIFCLADGRKVGSGPAATVEGALRRAYASVMHARGFEFEIRARADDGAEWALREDGDWEFQRRKAA